LVTALRATPYCWQRHHVSVPSSLLQLENKLVRLPPYDELLQVWDNTPEDDTEHNRVSYFSPQHRLVWDEAIRHMAHVAAGHLARAQAMQSEVPREGRAALLPVVPAMHYLSRLQEHNSNVFDPHPMYLIRNSTILPNDGSGFCCCWDGPGSLGYFHHQ
jgi:hypothetical protein